MDPWASLINPPKVAPPKRLRTIDFSPRAQAAEKLLRLGGLSWGQFVEITGWPEFEAAGVLGVLKSAGIVDRVDGQWGLA